MTLDNIGFWMSKCVAESIVGLFAVALGLLLFVGVFMYERQERKKGMNGLSFGAVLDALKLGKKACRAGWNGKGMWIALQEPGNYSKMTLPYLYIEYPKGHVAYPDGSRVPWLASQTDMLAEDWAILE